MRNFEERKAEVFRRSEKRIKARKARRNHILMVCIPLVLCVSLFSAFILPKMMPERAADSAPAEDALNGMGQNISQSTAFPVSRITVSGHDFSRSYEGSSDVAQICGFFSSLGQNGAVTDGTSCESLLRGDKKEPADVVYESIADTAGAGYTIILLTDKGDQTAYDLTGNTLTDLTAGKVYPLSQEQADELKNLLGIPR